MATNEPTAAPDVRELALRVVQELEANAYSDWVAKRRFDSIEKRAKLIEEAAVSVEQAGYDRAVRDVLAWLRAKREPNWRSDDPWRVAGIYELAALAIEAGDHRPKWNA